jgi:hypothetical protein
VQMDAMIPVVLVVAVSEDDTVPVDDTRLDDDGIGEMGQWAKKEAESGGNTNYVGGSLFLEKRGINK